MIAVEVIITSAVIMVQVIDCEEEKGAYMAPADRC